MSPAALLDFEATHPKHTSWKESAIRDELGLTPARYYVLLRRAAVSLEGQSADAVTAHRVLRNRVNGRSATLSDTPSHYFR